MSRPRLSELVARADELADAFESFEPTDEDHERPLPAEVALKLAAWRRNLAEKELSDAVHAARSQKLSWRAIGEAVGTTGEAARQRYGAN